MLSVAFSNAALLFYIFVILTEFITRYGIQETIQKGQSKILPIADTGGVIAFIFLLYYSFSTVWWAFIVLLLFNFLFYRVVRMVITLVALNKKFHYSVISRLRYMLIPLVLLMFILVKK